MMVIQMYMMVMARMMKEMVTVTTKRFETTMIMKRNPTMKASIGANRPTKMTRMIKNTIIK